MKKKGLAMFALAAVMSLGAVGITAFAAGWSQEGSNWVYYNNNGSKVTNAWRQAQDGTWRYLESSGAMATNKWVDNDDYYVDADGIMYTDQWLKVTDEDGNQEWYYFSSTGKAIKDNWKKIDDKWYHFDSDGRMETGWIEDDMYYCNASGEMLTGWQQLYSPDEEDSDSVTPGYDSLGYDGGKNWYYFSPTGKKYLPDEDESGDDYGTRKIEGYYYCFDEEGAMQTGWLLKNGKYYFLNTDGTMAYGWVNTQGNWYYFDMSTGEMLTNTTVPDGRYVNAEGILVA